MNQVIKDTLFDGTTKFSIWDTTPALFDINECLLARGEQTHAEYTANAVTGPAEGSIAEDLLRAGDDGHFTLDDLNHAMAVIDRLDVIYRARGQSL